MPLGNTLLLALSVVAISLPLGSMLAWLLARIAWPGRRLVLVVLALSIALPLYLQAAGWDAGFGRQGWFTYRSSLVQTPPLRGWFAVILIHSIYALPWVTLIMAVGFRQIEPQLEELARIDLPWWQVFTRVALSRAQASAWIAAGCVVAQVTSEMTVTDMYQVRTFAEELYTGLALGDDLATVACTILPGAVAMSAAVGTMLWGIRVGLPARSTGTRAPLPLFQPGPERWLITFVVGGGVLALATIPFANLCYQAGLTTVSSATGIERIWSLGKCGAMVFESVVRFRDEWLGTVELATYTAMITMGIAIVAAWWSRAGGKRTVVIVALAAMALAAPGPLVALTLLRIRDIWDPPGWELLAERTTFMVAGVLALRVWPIAWAICWRGFRSLPAAQFEQAQLAGLGSTRQLLTMVLPQRRAAIAAGGLVAWIVAAGDLTTTILLLPPGRSTVAVRTFQLVHAGVDDRLAGLTLSTTAMFGMLSLLVLAIVPWRRSRLQ